MIKSFPFTSAVNINQRWPWRHTSVDGNVMISVQYWPPRHEELGITVDMLARFYWFNQTVMYLVVNCDAVDFNIGSGTFRPFLMTSSDWIVLYFIHFKTTRGVLLIY